MLFDLDTKENVHPMMEDLSDTFSLKRFKSETVSDASSEDESLNKEPGFTFTAYHQELFGDEKLLDSIKL